MLAGVSLTALIYIVALEASVAATLCRKSATAIDMNMSLSSSLLLSLLSAVELLDVLEVELDLEPVAKNRGAVDVSRALDNGNM